MTSVVPYAEVIGDPISHSKSPLIHKFWLEKLGLEYDYKSRRVGGESLPDYVEARRLDPHWCGANVTMPLKLAVQPLLDHLSDEAALIGAVNTIAREGRDHRLVGHNTDWRGVREPLRDWLDSDHFFSAKVIGTGGAAAAAMFALKQRSTAISLTNYGRTHASALAFRRRFDDEQYASGAIGDLARPEGGGRDPSLLINASPLGMCGRPPLAIDLGFLAPGSIVFEMVYDPLETRLVSEARKRGLHVVDGLDMLIAQAAAAFALFFCEAAPREHDGELRELLTA